MKSHDNHQKNQIKSFRFDGEKSGTVKFSSKMSFKISEKPEGAADESLQRQQRTGSHTSNKSIRIEMQPAEKLNEVSGLGSGHQKLNSPITVFAFNKEPRTQLRRKLDMIEEQWIREEQSSPGRKERKNSKHSDNEAYFIGWLQDIKKSVSKEIKEIFMGNSEYLLQMSQICHVKKHMPVPFNQLGFVQRQEAENKFIEFKRNQKVIIGQLLRIIQRQDYS